MIGLFLRGSSANSSSLLNEKIDKAVLAVMRRSCTAVVLRPVVLVIVLGLPSQSL